jgi:hypothetical protein
MIEGLIEEPDLEYALAVQRERGGLLGEILVSLGFVSTSEIATALGSQHGVHVEMAIKRRERRLRVPPPPTKHAGGAPWRPLGRLLVEKGLLSESGLERALVDQRATGRLLGEIVVSRGWVSAEDLARTVAEQHGILIEGEIDARAAEPTNENEAFEIRSAETGLVHTSSTFLDATDLAFDLIERDDPEAMEIIRVTDDRRERVWSYSRERAEQEAARTAALGPFGYDVTGWDAGHRLGERNGAKADPETDAA